MATMSAVYGLGWCTALFAYVDLPVSAVQDVVNEPSAAIARCVALTDEVLKIVAEHHVAATPRDELERSFRRALRGAAPNNLAKAEREKLPWLGWLFPPSLADDFDTLDGPHAIAAWWNNWVSRADGESRFRLALNQWLQALPGGGAIVPAEEHRVARQFAANQYVGIGIALGTANNELTIGQALPGGPAERGGLQRDDHILAIDGWSTSGQPLAQVLARIRGEPGSNVTITIERNGQRRDMVLTRDFIRFDTVTDLAQQPLMKQTPRPLKENGAVAGLLISRLTGSTVSELRQWERTIRGDASKRAVIIDLRAIQHDRDAPNLAVIADALIDGRTLWYEVRRDNTPVAVPADRECLFRGMPLAVLVSDQTPPAGWILARALQAGRQAAIVHQQQWSVATDDDAGLPRVMRDQSPESAALLLTEAFSIDQGRQVVHVATREVRFRESSGHPPVTQVWKSLGAASGSIAVVRGDPRAAINTQIISRSAAWTAAYRKLIADLNPGYAANRQADAPVELARDWLLEQLPAQESSP